LSHSPTSNGTTEPSLCPKIRPGGTVADYHFARQLSDGTWADKPGLEPARWNVLGDPESSWYYLNWADYYDTEPKYFAVKE